MKPIEISGYEGQNIAVQLPRVFSSARLFINNQPAPVGPKKGQFLMYRNDGVQEIATFKGGFPDPVPTLMVGGRPIKLAPPLEWYQWVWAGFPLVLILLGGALGGFLGTVATMLNTHIMRSSLPVPVRYLLAAVVTIVTFTVFVVLILMLKGNPIPQPQP